MELTYNNDTAFFNVSCKDFRDKDNVLKLIDENVESFNVTEELGKITTGSLCLLDKNNIYSKLFRYGMEFKVAWGYGKWNANSLLQGQGPSSSFRQGLRCVVMNPSGFGDRRGKVGYNVNFYSTEILAQKRVRVFDSGNKSDVVAALFNDLGCSSFTVKLDDQEQNFQLSTENSVRQSENSFATLKRLAVDWHCTLQVGYDRNGNKVGLFVKTNQANGQEVADFLKSVGVENPRKVLYFNNGDLSNVESYEWQNHVGDSGQGFIVRIDPVNGVLFFQRFKAETQSVITYAINQPRIAQYVREHQVQEAALLEEIRNAQDYDGRIGDRTVLWFFDPAYERTAPDGLGFTVNVHMRGDPFVTPNLQVDFGDNFTSELMFRKAKKAGTSPLSLREQLSALQRPEPDFKAPIYFTVRKAAHTVTRDGYETDAEVVDGYILNQGFLQDTTLPQTVPT